MIEWMLLWNSTLLSRLIAQSPDTFLIQTPIYRAPLPSSLAGGIEIKSIQLIHWATGIRNCSLASCTIFLTTPFQLSGQRVQYRRGPQFLGGIESCDRNVSTTTESVKRH